MSGNDPVKDIANEAGIKTETAAALSKLAAEFVKVLPKEQVQKLKDDLDKEIQSVQVNAVATGYNDPSKTITSQDPNAKVQVSGTLTPEEIKARVQQFTNHRYANTATNGKPSPVANDIIADIKEMQAAGKDIMTLAKPLAEILKGKMSEEQVTNYLKQMKDGLPQSKSGDAQPLMEKVASELVAEQQLKAALKGSVDGAVIVPPLETPKNPAIKDTIPQRKQG